MSSNQEAQTELELVDAVTFAQKWPEIKEGDLLSIARFLHGHAKYLVESAIKPIDKQKIIDGIKKNGKHPEGLIDTIAYNTVKYLEQKNQEELLKAIEYFQLAADTYQFVGDNELSQVCLEELAKAKH